MRIFLFARRYPVPYKPYYDAQFASLVARGHEVAIFATGAHDAVRNEKVVRYGLAERTTYFPATLATVPKYLPSVVGRSLFAPGRSLARTRQVMSGVPLRRGLLDAMKALTLPHERPDLCLVHGLGTAIMLPWLKQVFSQTPVAMYYHGGEVPSSNRFDDANPERAFRAFDVVFTNTEFSRQHAIERGCPAAKVVVLPVGFDLADFSPPEHRSYRRGGTLRLLSAGRMSSEKGFEFALQAVNTLVRNGIRDIHYSLTGTGYLRPALEDYVRRERLEPYVSFLGTLTTDGVIRVMGESDALLLPSIQVGNWVENQACAVQEAMLMKALVVTSRTGGVPESIPPEMQSYVVQPGNAGELARAIAAIHALSLTELNRLGELCRSFVVARYDVDKLNDRIIELTFAASGRRLPDAHARPDPTPVTRVGC
jgi:colanic acid/amylovoran biosynthesis glycosyltransferase